ncbi:hypothetical protein OUZ56_024613 [Daphnia magna]|uniref:Uncharacterized protein n=1 Tax=Daphnia magna TaxID=35525 RepID=A0ABR0B124_9CRUS|nr:hypothetical protein OUZ56_024613 [Daphnia magna]
MSARLSCVGTLELRSHRLLAFPERSSCGPRCVWFFGIGIGLSPLLPISVKGASAMNSFFDSFTCRDKFSFVVDKRRRVAFGCSMTPARCLEERRSPLSTTSVKVPGIICVGESSNGFAASSVKF